MVTVSAEIAAEVAVKVAAVAQGEAERSAWRAVRQRLVDPVQRVPGEQQRVFKKRRFPSQIGLPVASTASPAHRLAVVPAQDRWWRRNNLLRVRVVRLVGCRVCEVHAVADHPFGRDRLRAGFREAAGADGPANQQRKTETAVSSFVDGQEAIVERQPEQRHAGAVGPVAERAVVVLGFAEFAHLARRSTSARRRSRPGKAPAPCSSGSIRGSSSRGAPGFPATVEARLVLVGFLGLGHRADQGGDGRQVHRPAHGAEATRVRHGAVLAGGAAHVFHARR